MRYKIEQLEDITDSREIMAATPQGISKYLTYVIAALLAVVLIWSVIAKKQVVVNVPGVIKPAEEVYKISSTADGHVTSVNLSEGQEVKKGDVLLVIDGEELEIQQKSIQESYDKKKKELDAANKLLDSVNNDTNELSEDDEIEGVYYKKYELYKNIENGYNSQASASNSQIESLKSKNDNLKLLLDSINEGTNKLDSSNYMYYQYEEYATTMSKYDSQINSYDNQINSLAPNQNNLTGNENNEIPENQMPEGTIDPNVQSQINALEKEKQSVITEKNNYKNSQCASIKQQIEENEKTLQQNPDASSVNSDSYKDQFLSEINTTITSLDDAVKELKGNLDVINSKVEKSTIKAQYDGIINLITEVSVGDTVQNGMPIASIMPEEKSSFIAEVYIDNQSIGEISEDKDVIIEIDSLPQSSYGHINSKISNISADAKINQETNTSFYTGQCNIEETFLTNEKDEEKEIKSGMTIKAKIIKREVSYFRYFLEKINILKE